jgi:REP element-mobilizing transposase RayT
MRRPRLHVPGGFYHVTLRGNHRQDIFFSDEDRLRLERYVATALEQVGARIHAYCWMTNHIHLLIQVADTPLGAFMQRIGTRYARAVQARVPTTGHLFQNRYHALLVDVDRYFLALLRYIHLNPVRAGLVSDPEDYRWSSHRAYLGLADCHWLETEFGLRMFNAHIAGARDRYRAFVVQAIGSPRDPQLTAPTRGEPRVLGDDVFLQTLAARLAEQLDRIGVVDVAELPSVDAVAAQFLEPARKAHRGLARHAQLVVLLLAHPARAVRARERVAARVRRIGAAAAKAIAGDI